MDNGCDVVVYSIEGPRTLEEHPMSSSAYAAEMQRLYRAGMALPITSGIGTTSR